MTRKSRRPGTRGGRRAESIGEPEHDTEHFERAPPPRPKPKVRLPSDLADAAEAALDDIFDNTLEGDVAQPATREPSQRQIVSADDGDETVAVSGGADLAMSAAVRPVTSGPSTRRSKLPLPGTSRASAHTVPASPAGAAGRATPPTPIAVRPSSSPSVPRPSSSSVNAAPTRTTPPPSQVPSLRVSMPIEELSPLPPLARPRSAPMTGEPAPTAHGAAMLDRDDELDAPTELPHRTVGDETARLGDRLPMDLDTALDSAFNDPLELADPAVTIDLDASPILEEIDAPLQADLAPLQIVIYEDSLQLPNVHAAVTTAGHVVTVAAAGRDGMARAIQAIRRGATDVVVTVLPGGEPLIDAALALEPRRPVVIAVLAGTALDAIARAHAAGADLAITRPHDVERHAPVLHAASRLLFEKRVAASARGAEHVLRARLEELSDPDPRGLLPVEMFQRALDLEIKRAKRYEYPLSVALFAIDTPPPAPSPGIRNILRARAGNALTQTIRDIDMATQLDDERFLVLLPYTDLKGAAGLGRRVIAAVGALDPVIAGGQSFVPRAVGAVAGGATGQPTSFEKLMKNATRALEQARRDGAELAVQP